MTLELVKDKNAIETEFKEEVELITPNPEIWEP